MKRFLAGVALVALLAGVLWAAYSRDVSGDGNVMITAAIEYLINNGMTVNAGTNLNTSALATAAKQPSLGTAGTASANVLTVQGVASMTPILTTEASAAAIAADLNELTAAPVAETPVPLTAIVVTATGTPVPLVASQTFATEIHLYAGRASAANTGLVTVGVGNAIRIATARQQVLAPGESYIIRSLPGKKVDMALFFVDAATNNDGCTGWYKP